MSQDGNVPPCSQRPWEGNDMSIPEWQGPNDFNSTSPQHRSHYRPVQHSQSQSKSFLLPARQPSSMTSITAEIKRRISRYIGTPNRAPSFPNYPKLPPPTAYRNSNRNRPLRAFPIQIQPTNLVTSPSQDDQTEEMDSQKLCQFFANISRSNSSVAFHNSSKNQLQTTLSQQNIQHQMQLRDQRSEVNQSQTFFKLSQASNSCSAIEGVRTPLTPSYTRHDLSQQQPQYVPYSCRQVPGPIDHNQFTNHPNGYFQNLNQNALVNRPSNESHYDPNNGTLGESCQERDPRTIHYAPSRTIFPDQVSKPMYHCGGNVDNSCRQNVNFYGPSSSGDRPMYPPQQQQVKIQQAHLTLKTTEVATFPNGPIYPSHCNNLWQLPPTGRPGPNLLSNQQSRHSELHFLQPLGGYMTGPCQMPTFPGGMMTPGSYCPEQPQIMHQPLPNLPNYDYQGNQFIGRGDSNQTGNGNSHTVVDLGGIQSDTRLQQMNHSQASRPRPWNLQAQPTSSSNNEINNSFPAADHQNQNQVSKSLMESNSNSSLSGNEGPPLNNPKSVAKKNFVNKKVPPKVKGRVNKADHIVPSVEEALTKFDKDIQKKTLEQGFQYLRSGEWIENVFGLKILILYARNEPDSVTDRLDEFLVPVYRHLSSPKSKLCRQAISCLKELFLQLGYLIDGQLDRLSEKLLNKTMDTNKFIKDDVETALEAMVRSCSPNHVLFCLDAGRKHKHLTVRRSCCRMIRVFIDRHRYNLTLLQYGEKILPALYSFLEEPSNDIREEAKKAVMMIIEDPDFDELVEKFVDPNIAKRVCDRVDRIRDEVQNRTPRRQRRKNDHLFG